MLLTTLTLAAIVVQPTALFEGLDPTWSPDGKHIASLTEHGRSVQIHSLDGKLVSTLKVSETDNWTEIDSIIWSPEGDHILVSDHEETHSISDPQLVKARVIRVPIKSEEGSPIFGVADTGEVEAGKMEMTTHIFSSLRYIGLGLAAAVAVEFKHPSKAAEAKRVAVALDFGGEALTQGQPYPDLREFAYYAPDEATFLLTWAAFEVRSPKEDVAFMFRLEFGSGFDFSLKSDVICWTTGNSVCFRKRKADQVIEYHLGGGLYGLGRVQISPDGEQIAFSAFKEVNILDPENDPTSVYVMDVPPEFLKN